MNFISINAMPHNLVNYGIENYTELYRLAPDELGSVIIKDKIGNMYRTKQIYRKYKSYLNIPGFDQTTNKSYMFSEKESKDTFEPLPELFRPYYDFVSFLDSGYNQVVINWYDNGDNYIEPHSDCDAKFIRDYKILVISINQDNSQKRDMLFQERNNANKFQIELNSSFYLLMSQAGNRNYRHSIPKNNVTTSRISLTFRQVRV